ncbi:HGGxSTG domain-containing protein [Domibacillus sp. 8LH]|uniref:HGGxSTG domain-containing protein n=1 Tax=Domibacillus sp. 8LH TaxID=3073900 RepID=UPI00317EA1EF
MKEKVICGAKAKSTGKPCQRRALKNGRCSVHGGKSTGPKDKEKHRNSLLGNKNAVKTGEYETISYDMLSDEEKELYEQVPEDTVKQVKGRYNILEIRTRRMLKLWEDEILKDKTSVETILKIEDALARQDPRALELIREMRELASGENNADGSLDKLVMIIQQHRESRLSKK